MLGGQSGEDAQAAFVWGEFDTSPGPEPNPKPVFG